METEALERFTPIMLQCLLVAVRRFEPDLYAHFCRKYHLDADRMLGLFDEVELTGAGQMLPLLADIRSHQAYHDIVFLAGRNALQLEAERGVKLRHTGGDAARFQSLLKQLLPPFLGRANYTMMVRGEMYFIELRDSLFARGVWHHNPVCGFYAGLLTQLGSACSAGVATSAEVRCIASDPEATSCMFRVNL